MLTFPQNKKTGLMDLSNELIERILEYVLVADRPIELAPLRAVEDMLDVPPQAIDSSHASYYMSEIRRTLAVLRTSKLFHVTGVRTYYSKNAFRFSNISGIQVLSWFLHLIGRKNADMLRDVTICHPSQAWETSKLLATSMQFWQTDLAPFGMPTWSPRRLVCSDSRWGVRFAVDDVLRILEKLRSLKSLTFLHRPSGSVERLWGSNWDVVDLQQSTASESRVWCGTSMARRRFLHLLRDPETSPWLTKPDELPAAFSEWDKAAVRISCAALTVAGLELKDMTLSEYDSVVFGLVATSATNESGKLPHHRQNHLR